VNHIGPYLLNRIRAREGDVEIWEGQDTVTGTPVLIYRPLAEAPPALRIQGILPWQGREEDAWVAGLPFGAVPLGERRDEVTPEELTAWSRRLLAALLEMRALELQHGRIDPERIWVKGEEAWLEGVGLPVPARTADEAALVEALREVAADTWPGWTFHRVLEELAEGGIELRQAAEYLADPKLIADLADEEEPPAASEAPEEMSSGTVRVLQRPASPRAGAPAEDGAVDAASAEDEATGSEAEKEESAPQSTPLFAPEAEEPSPQPPTSRPALKVAEEPEPHEERRPTDPSRVVRIDEVSEPAFEVIEPGGAVTERRQFVRAGLLGLIVLLVAGAVWWAARPKPATGAEGYPVEFRVEPADGRAELVLLGVPEGSGLTVGRVLAIIPGKVYFDVPGVYRIQIRAEGYLPQEKLLTVPPSGRTVTVRLGP